MSAPDPVATLTTLRARLLASRDGRVHWTGHLSSSALSTATAVMALHLANPRDPLVDAGQEWLARTQNTDGGFGDTTDSLSNLSTSALCLAAFVMTGREHASRERLAGFVRAAAGGLDADTLTRAIAGRYGKDQTFSVPILTVLAVAGLVPWRRVPQLPFELAACPRSWFAALGLPVVSYALPALIAIGMVRHRRHPSRNPAARAVRAAVAGRTLRMLARVQPEHGGYLEATPLTSFVCIALQAAGITDGPVVSRGLDFLRRSARSDGSWPIDTNLATWLTTLSINALRDDLPDEDRAPLAEWLVGQQYRHEHPFTGAAPGGWAWTNLPGGVPDADDTSGALLALHTLGVRTEPLLAAVRPGVRWLMDLQNRDGGMPTFCRGWGTLPFDCSSADITAHALLAWSAWRSACDTGEQARLDAATAAAVRFLERTQRPDGAWTPLWFGNQRASRDENPVYGTARVLLGLSRAAPESGAIARGVAWLVSAQHETGGWGGDHGVPPSIEETSLAIAALADRQEPPAREAVGRGVAWLTRATRTGEDTPPVPIGLYFARLWYHEAAYPMVFAADALRRVLSARPR